MAITSTAPRHFLDIHLLSLDQLDNILALAANLKANKVHINLREKFSYIPTLAMLFDKPSTRTRVSFDIAMRQIGGETNIINSSDMQLGRGETVADTARVLSRYVDIIMLRSSDHAELMELAEYSHVPVVNGLTNMSHPCQIMADILTYQEKLGSIKGQTLAWVGDGNNVALSWIHAAVLFGFKLNLACPKELSPNPEIWEWIKAKGGDVTLTTDPKEAVRGASCVSADVWVSMGDADADWRDQVLRPYQVNSDLMALADKNAIFMHCLPAHRGDEVTADVIDGPQSVVFDEAENRLHVQKAILAWCLGEI